MAGGFVQVDDILEAEGLPDPENKSKQEEGMEGMGDLGRNLEFMMMKIAQLDFFCGEGVLHFKKHAPQSLSEPPAHPHFARRRLWSSSSCRSKR